MSKQASELTRVGNYSVSEAIIDLRNWAICPNPVNKESLHRIADTLEHYLRTTDEAREEGVTEAEQDDKGYPMGDSVEVDAAAKAIYDHWEFRNRSTTPTWVDRGNSLMQDRARAFARTALATLRRQRANEGKVGEGDKRFPGSVNPVAAFKAFHENLCRRFDYPHDEQFWWRDLVSLEEHIAKLQPAANERTTAGEDACDLLRAARRYVARFLENERTAILRGQQNRIPGFRAERLLEDIDAYLARPAPSSAPAVSEGWQPIDSAPKDGTEIVTYSKFTQSQVVMSFREPHTGDADQQDFKHWRAKCCGRSHTPTHWKPLAAAPSPEGKV